MKKICRLFSILLAVVMLFTSVGMVFADDAPPPQDDQSLPATSGPIYPNDGDTIYQAITLFFNWNEVKGADKYKLELQKQNNLTQVWAAVANVTVAGTRVFPIPPTTATVTSKKPFAAGNYRWRVTAFNSGVGIDSAGAGQTSVWWDFSYLPYVIAEMYPQTVTGTTGAYNGRIDPKKFDGTNLSAPQLNWEVGNGNGLYSTDTFQFVVTVKQGKKTWTTTVKAKDACPGSLYNYFGRAVCSADLPEAMPKPLTPGIPYTWQVVGVDTPANFKTTPATLALKDTFEYNPLDSKLAPLSAIVTDTMYTNKPTFQWTQPAGGLPAVKGAVYQLVVEKDDLKKSGDTWTSFGTAQIVPGVTKNPVTKALVCPSSGGNCRYTFATVTKYGYQYRWNVRILAGGKYGPWAYPGDSGLGSDNMVQKGIYGNDYYFNYFYGISQPTAPEITAPTVNYIFDAPADDKPAIQWECSNKYTELDYYDGYGFSHFKDSYYVDEYKIDLKRVSPAPLTTTTKTISVLDSGNDTFDCEVNSTEMAAALAGTAYSDGLPRGIYEVLVTPNMHIGSGQVAAFPSAIKSQVSSFVVGSKAPADLSATYNATTKMMVLTFTPESAKAAKDVKYRFLVNMIENGVTRWIKISTFSGTACPVGSAKCTLSFLINKPGGSLALDPAYTYEVQVQEAMKDETSTTKWSPFGRLSSAVSVVFE